MVTWSLTGTEGSWGTIGVDNQTCKKTSGQADTWQQAFNLGSSAIGTTAQAFKFSVNANNTHIAAGISTIAHLQSGNTDQDSFDWGFYLKADGNYVVYVDGDDKTSDESYTISTTFQINMSPTGVIFKVNGSTVWNESTHLPNSGTTYNIAWNIYSTAITQLTALSASPVTSGTRLPPPPIVLRGL